MLDMDNFKLINDRSTDTLAAIGSFAAWPVFCRPSCARAISWGAMGREFAVILPIPSPQARARSSTGCAPPLEHPARARLERSGRRSRPASLCAPISRWATHPRRRPGPLCCKEGRPESRVLEGRLAGARTEHFILPRKAHRNRSCYPCARPSVGSQPCSMASIISRAESSSMVPAKWRSSRPGVPSDSQGQRAGEGNHALLELDRELVQLGEKLVFHRGADHRLPCRHRGGTFPF
jgi:hypothetical protein